MKKFISLLLVCLMVVPFGMLASTGVSAAGNTVYLSDAGDDTKSGADAANAVKTMQVAYMKLGAAGGTIVINGTYTQSTHFKADSAHTGKVTIKGADASAKWVVTANARFILQGPTEITDLVVDITAGSWYVICLFNNFTATETMSMAKTTKTLITMGGQNYANEGGNDYTPKDTTVTLNGGYWQEVIGMMRNGASTTASDIVKQPEEFKDVDLVLNVGGSAVLEKMFMWGRSLTTNGVFVAENATMTVNLNGGKITRFFCLHDMKGYTAGFGGGMTVNIGKNFNIAESFDANTTIDADRIASDNVRQSLCGEFVWPDSLITTTDRIDTSVVVIADEKYDEAVASGKIFGFKEVKKASEVNTGNQGGNDNQGGGNADTSDMTWVVAAIAAVSVMGCAVVVATKKRTHN